MDIDSLPLPTKAIEFLKSKGIVKFFPPQEEALKRGILKRKNFLMASPTASGKTLVAEMAFLKNYFELRGKCLYLVPLRALAREKYKEFKGYEHLGMKVAITTGDYDTSDSWLDEYDLIICSVDFDEPIIIKKDNRLEIVKIGEFVDRLMSEEFPSKAYIFDVLDVSDRGYEVLSVNTESLKLEFRKVKKVIRHIIREPLYRITLEDGRRVSVTASHSIYVAKGEKIFPEEVWKLKVGDFIVALKYFINPKSEGSLFLREGDELKNYTFPPLQPIVEVNPNIDGSEHLTLSGTIHIRDLLMRKEFTGTINDDVEKISKNNSSKFLSSNSSISEETFEGIVLSGSDIRLLRISKIEVIPPSSPYVYDISVEGSENFVSGFGGILCHNTNEKADSLLRHKARWIQDIGTLVVDEIHMIGDPHRGPVLENVIMTLRKVVPEAQIIALSATVSNAEEIAEWLDAEYVLSEWRPVRLREGVCYQNHIFYSDGEEEVIRRIAPNPTINLAMNKLLEGGQVLIFTGTRQSSISMAKKIAPLVDSHLPDLNRDRLSEISEEILSSTETTHISKLLSELVSKGVAFHNAGLHYKHREIIEDVFRENSIKVICATPTLAAGVNLPSRTVIIDTYYRYDSSLGSRMIPVLEYKQMCFPSGTLIRYSDGSERDIEDVEVGDHLLSYDLERREFRSAVVLKKFSRFVEEIIKIETNDGSFILTTPEHPFMTESSWKEAREILLGEDVYLIKGNEIRPFKVVKLSRMRGKFLVYNLSLEYPNVFFANGFLVHNCGRAGRPKYDDFGEAFLMAKKKSDVEKLIDKYVNGIPERIYSKIGDRNVLRSIVLSSISTGYSSNMQDLMRFFEGSLYAYQVGDVSEIKENLSKAIRFLLKEKFLERIDRKSNLRATEFGRRTSELYLDPVSAVIMRDGLLRIDESKCTSFTLLHLIAHTPDMESVYLRRSDYEWIFDVYDEKKEEVLFGVDDYEDLDFLLSELKVASILEDWINEVGEETILLRYDIGSGDLLRMVETADWLLYALKELSKIFRPEMSRESIDKLKMRVKYGVREELLDLVKIENVGRVRARILYQNGFKTIDDVRKADPKEIAKLPRFGMKLATKIIEHANLL
ncbi:MAG: DEAD/DEAH box helicase [Candidatus Asgardarchaeia archaeon]